MVQVVIASHGLLSKEIVNSAAMILGNVPSHIHLLSIIGEGGIEKLRIDSAALAQKLQDVPVLLLTDLFGGSPFMTVLSTFRDCEYKVITGYNLPMVMEAFSVKESDILATLTAQLIETGTGAIKALDKITQECLEEEADGKNF